VILSTDSNEYAEEGLRFGCWVPGLRPPELSLDPISIVDVLIDLIKTTPGGETWETLSIIEPTSPLRTPQMVIDCVRLCQDDTAVNSSLTLTPISVQYHALKQLILGKNGNVSFAHPQGAVKNPNRQQLTPTSIRNGIAGTIRCDSFLKAKNILHGNIKGLYIPQTVVNIDTLEDIEELRKFGTVELVS